MNTTDKISDTVTNKVVETLGDVNIKKINVEVEKDGKTYKLDVNPSDLKA